MMLCHVKKDGIIFVSDIKSYNYCIYFGVGAENFENFSRS